jgi:hypothetical protein
MTRGYKAYWLWSPERRLTWVLLLNANYGESSKRVQIGCASAHSRSWPEIERTRFAQYLGLDLSIVRRYNSPPTRSPTIDGVEWLNPQSLMMFFMPCPIRPGEKFWSNCLSGQPQSASWQHRST